MPASRSLPVALAATLAFLSAPLAAGQTISSPSQASGRPALGSSAAPALD